MLTARAATEADASLLMKWRNDPETRRWSRTTEQVDPEGHRAWLRRSLANDNRLLLVVEDDAGPVGTVRWDYDADVWEVSVTVAPERRGTGLAGPLLAAGEAALRGRVQPPVPLLAIVHEDNEASNRLFARAGYELSGSADEGGFVPRRKLLA